MQFRAWVSETGKAVWHKPEELAAKLKDYIGKEIVVTIERWHQKRSDRQNRWYWSCVVPAVADYLSQGREFPISNDDTHFLLKRAFLGAEETALGLLPKSTTQLDIVEFTEYVEAIRAHAASEWGLSISDPE
jgi:hypothetical protein